MTPAADPAQEVRRRLIGAVVAACGLVAVAGLWAFGHPTLPSVPPLVPHAAAVTARPPATIVPLAWNVTLWQPLSDAPVSAAPTAPLMLKLFSILRQGDGLIAAIDPGDGAGLVYAHAGDLVKGATITAVDDKGVSVRYAGGNQRLELAP